MNRLSILTLALFCASLMQASGVVSVLIDDDFDTDTHDSVPAIQVGDVGDQWFLTHGSHENSVRVINAAGSPAGATGNTVRQSESFGTGFGHIETTPALEALTTGQVIEVSYRMTMTSGAATSYHLFHGSPLGSADLPGAGAGDDQLLIDASYYVYFYGDGNVSYYSGGTIDTGIDFIPGEWNDISLTVDLANKLYDLSISNSSGTVTATGLGFRNASANSLKTVGFIQGGAGTTVAWVDDFYATVDVVVPPPPAPGTIISDNFNADTHDTSPAIQAADVGAQWFLSNGSIASSIKVIGTGAPAGSTGLVLRQTKTGGGYGHVETTPALAATTVGEVVTASYRMTMTSGGAGDYHAFNGTPVGSADLPGAPFGDDQLFIDAAFSVAFYGDGTVKYVSGIFVDTGITFIPAEWNEITVTVDLTTKLFDLSISNSSGTSTATGLGFRNASADSIKTVGIYQSAPGTMEAWVDDVSVVVYIPPQGTVISVR